MSSTPFSGFGGLSAASIPPKIVLNMAAGYLAIAHGDFGNNVKVYNYDPLIIDPTDIDSILTFTVKKKFNIFLNFMEDVLYFEDEEKIKAELAPSSIDLLICISPYGFTLVTQWVHERLKTGAYILVFGNNANKFLKKKSLFESSFSNKYVEHKVCCDTFAKFVIEKISTYYQSNATGLKHDTTLNMTLHYIKVCE
jgi:hypothetical protein